MPAGWEDDGSSVSPLALAGRTRLPGLVTDLTFALFAQPVFGPLGAFCELTPSDRLRAGCRLGSRGRFGSRPPPAGSPATAVTNSGSGYIEVSSTGDTS